MLTRAFEYAHKLHRKQKRKQAPGADPADGIPYISHLMAVTALVLEHGGTETEAVAALLHDGPEDQGGRKTLKKIRKKFGKEVAEIVKHCSDTFRNPKPEWRVRKTRYHAKLREAPESAVLVSLADKVHNAESTVEDLRVDGHAIWERFTGSRDDSLWNYRTLLEIYRKRAPERAAKLVARLERAVAQLSAEKAAERLDRGTIE